MEYAATTKRRRRANSLSAELVGAVTIMRPVCIEDLEQIQAWDHDPEINGLMGRNFDQTTVQGWFDSTCCRRDCRAWAIETKEHRLIGDLELANLNWRTGSAELRICIGEKDCWNRGFGSDAIASALRLAFEEFQLESVYLRVFTNNLRAVKVYERFGFRREGILEPSHRRNDPAPVLLMTLTRHRWEARHSA